MNKWIDGGKVMEEPVIRENFAEQNSRSFGKF